METNTRQHDIGGILLCHSGKHDDAVQGAVGEAMNPQTVADETSESSSIEGVISTTG